MAQSGFSSAMVCVLTVLVTSASLAQESTPPTTWACSIDTLKSGKKCYFDEESSSKGALSAVEQDKRNEASYKKLMVVLCKSATALSAMQPQTPRAYDICLAELKAQAKYCVVEEGDILLPNSDTFSHKAKECYLSLSKSLSELNGHLNLAKSCCECVGRSTCKTSMDSCMKSLSVVSSRAAPKACLADSCRGECSYYFEYPVKKASDDDVAGHDSSVQQL